MSKKSNPDTSPNKKPRKNVKRSLYYMLRIGRDMSQTETAKAIGITPAYMGLVEQEKRQLHPSKMDAYLKLMGITYGEFEFLQEETAAAKDFPHALLAVMELYCSKLSTPKIEFTYCGQKYSMTQEEIDAAFWYTCHQVTLNEAARRFYDFVFSENGLQPGDTTYDEEDALFRQKYGISYTEACTLVPKIAELFSDSYDQDTDEDEQWDDAIRRALDARFGLIRNIE